MAWYQGGPVSPPQGHHAAHRVPPLQAGVGPAPYRSDVARRYPEQHHRHMHTSAHPQVQAHLPLPQPFSGYGPQLSGLHQHVHYDGTDPFVQAHHHYQYQPIDPVLEIIHAPHPPLERNTDLYRALQVPTNATDEEINKAFKRLAMQHHPDKCGPEEGEMFKKLNYAKSVLCDPEKRKEYDRFRAFDRDVLARWAEVQVQRFGGAAEDHIRHAQEWQREWQRAQREAALAAGVDPSVLPPPSPPTSVPTSPRAKNTDEVEVAPPVSSAKVDLEDIDEDDTHPEPRPQTCCQAEELQTNSPPAQRRSVEDPDSPHPSPKTRIEYYHDPNGKIQVRYVREPSGIEVGGSKHTETRNVETPLETLSVSTSASSVEGPVADPVPARPKSVNPSFIAQSQPAPVSSFPPLFGDLGGSPRYSAGLLEVRNELDRIAADYDSIFRTNPAGAQQLFIDLFEALVHVQGRINSLLDIPERLKQLRRDLYKRCCQLELMVQTEISRRYDLAEEIEIREYNPASEDDGQSDSSDDERDGSRSRAALAAIESDLKEFAREVNTLLGGVKTGSSPQLRQLQEAKRTITALHARLESTTELPENLKRSRIALQTRCHALEEQVNGELLRYTTFSPHEGWRQPGSPSGANSLEQHSFNRALRSVAGALMSHSGRIPTDAGERLEKGRRLLGQYEAVAAKEISQLRAKGHGPEFVAICLRGARDTTEQFLGWIRLHFLGSPEGEERNVEQCNLAIATLEHMEKVAKAFYEGNAWL